LITINKNRVVRAVFSAGVIPALVAALSAGPVLSVAAERDVAAPWCLDRGGRVEVVLADGTRADCLLDEHAIEADYAENWAEAMGQALHYGRLSGRLPGVVLILRTPSDIRFAGYLRADAAHYSLPLFIWVVAP
jgi:hypothetical protein